MDSSYQTHLTHGSPPVVVGSTVEDSLGGDSKTLMIVQCSPATRAKQTCRFGFDVGAFFRAEDSCGFLGCFFLGGIYQVFEKEIVQEKFSMK